MTKYRVFQLIDGPDDKTGAWGSVGVFEGRDPKGAVEAAVITAKDPTEFAQATFAVCTESAFHVLKPSRVDVETRVRFE